MTFQETALQNARIHDFVARTVKNQQDALRNGLIIIALQNQPIRLRCENTKRTEACTRQDMADAIIMEDDQRYLGMIII